MLVSGIQKSDSVIYMHVNTYTRGFPGGASGEDPSANAGDVRDMSSISESGGFPEDGVANHSSILTWRIPLIEEMVSSQG